MKEDGQLRCASSREKVSEFKVLELRKCNMTRTVNGTLPRTQELIFEKQVFVVPDVVDRCRVWCPVQLGSAIRIKNYSRGWLAEVE